MQELIDEIATPTQLRAYRAWKEYGSFSEAARKEGMDRRHLTRAVRTLQAKLAAKGIAPDRGLNHPLPEGQVLKGVSTLYDGTGTVKAQWVKTNADDEAKAVAMRAAIEGMKDELQPIPSIPAPSPTVGDLLTGYPVGDHHMGMLAWGLETGGDSYDLKIAEKLIDQSSKHLVATAPEGSDALVAFLGDFMHYDSMVAETPSSGNPLDADGRFPKMVRAAIRSMRRLIDMAAMKHSSVHVIIEIGNHDLASSIFLQETMYLLYEQNERVTIDTSPAHFHQFVFGSNMIATHHGHGVKMADLPLLAATDWPEAWGQTEHRVWWTGHIHHTQVHEFKGCSVESFRVLCPKDAWHHQKGYRSGRGMQSIVFHRDHGEVARDTVSPGMFR